MMLIVMFKLQQQPIVRSMEMKASTQFLLSSSHSALVMPLSIQMLENNASAYLSN